MECKNCGAKLNGSLSECPECKARIIEEKPKKPKAKKPSPERKSHIIAASAVAVIIAIVVGIGVMSLVEEHNVKKQNKAAFDTSLSSDIAATENDFQYSDSVVEINSKVIASDSSKITIRKTGTNEETTLVKGNLELGIVTDGKTVYYYDLDKAAIMSVDAKSKKTKEIVKVNEHAEVDEKSTMDRFFFARFDGAYKDYVYYQMAQGEEYMPNYMVNVKTGEVKKLNLTDYGTYKFQIAGGKIYFDIYRSMNIPTVLYSSNPDGSNVRTLVEGITNFDVVGDKLYYFKVDGFEQKVNKIMCMDLKTGKSKTVRENMQASSGGFTSYGMICDRTMGSTLATFIDYYDGTSQSLDGNGSKVCGEVAIVHAGVPDDISSDKAMEAAKVPEWYIVGKNVMSDIITLPQGTTPANFKDGYLYYYSYPQEGKYTINRMKVELGGTQ